MINLLLVLAFIATLIMWMSERQTWDDYLAAKYPPRHGDVRTFRWSMDENDTFQFPDGTETRLVYVRHKYDGMKREWVFDGYVNGEVSEG